MLSPHTNWLITFERSYKCFFFIWKNRSFCFMYKNCLCLLFPQNLWVLLLRILYAWKKWRNRDMLCLVMYLTKVGQIVTKFFFPKHYYHPFYRYFLTLATTYIVGEKKILISIVRFDFFKLIKYVFGCFCVCVLIPLCLLVVTAWM